MQTTVKGILQHGQTSFLTELRLMFRGTDLEFRVVRSHPVFADFLFSPLIVGSDSMACSNRVVTVVPMPFRLQ